MSHPATYSGTFRRVKTEDYYGEYDAVLNLKPGDVVCVRWPNKSVTVEKVHFELGSSSAQVDMNTHPDHFPTRKLYIEKDVMGKPTRIYLRGMMIKKPWIAHFQTARRAGGSL